MDWYVYIIKSTSRPEKIYIGSTNDIKRRIRNHNQGNTRSTRYFTPWILIYNEKYTTRKEALIRERQLKKWKNRKRIDSLIEKTSAHSSAGRAVAS
jgi:putative endonuclease